jgi:DNA-binding response OmpR family regulator
MRKTAVLLATRRRDVGKDICGPLTEAGFEVIEPPDTSSIIDHARQKSCKLAVVDGQLGDVLDALRAHPATAALATVVLLGQLDEVSAALRAGADDWLIWPASSDALVARVRLHDGLIEQRDKLALCLHTAGSPESGLAQPGATADHNALMTGKKVLVVAKDAVQRRLVTRAINATGAHVQASSDADDARSLLSAQLDALFVDWQAAELIVEARQARPSVKTVVMTSQPVFESSGQQIIGLPLSSVYITNVLARTDSNDAVAIREIISTTRKLLSGDIFGLEKYLSWGSAVHQRTLSDSEARHGVLEHIDSLCNACGIRRRIASQIQTVTDELMMNAMWDAPVDADGHARYGHRKRGERLLLEQSEHVTVGYGHDASTFAVSVRDRFGRLEYDRAVRYLINCFARGKNQINQGSGGAGLGLYMAFNAVSSFVINVAPGHCTEVVGLFNLFEPPSDEARRSFCYFRAPHQA